MKLERRNAYFCKNCRKVTITVDVNEGVTPAFIQCPHCNKDMASSFMYQIPGCMMFEYVPGIGMQELPADLEWYKPQANEIALLSDAEKEHVNNGGLLSRKRTKAKPIYRELK